MAPVNSSLCANAKGCLRIAGMLTCFDSWRTCSEDVLVPCRVTAAHSCLPPVDSAASPSLQMGAPQWGGQQ